tara:strand:- start:395 stop:1336 length:942 start_codon:yes stop_codon:yes gene_type:complete
MNFLRVVLGKQHMFFEECYSNGYIGVDFSMDIDFSNDLPENWRKFNKKYIPEYLNRHPDASKIKAGLACGAIHTLAKFLEQGDVILAPDGKGNYNLGEISGDYFYVGGDDQHFLRHRRNVNWLNKIIKREDMSDSLKNSSGSISTTCNLTKYSEEIKKLMGDLGSNPVISNDSDIENPSEFVLEEHLEDFLVKNWSQTDLSNEYDIYEDEEFTGRQYQTDTGPIDILAVSKDKTRLLVIELKKGRASDRVVGQIQRYMGYIKDEIAENNQTVKGIIIAFEDDQRIRRALSVTNNIDFYRYRINFNLSIVIEND